MVEIDTFLEFFVLHPTELTECGLCLGNSDYLQTV
jgi:hypothetical protein